MAINHEFLHLYYSLSSLDVKKFTAYVKKNVPADSKNLSVLQYLKTTKGDIDKFDKAELIKKQKLDPHKARSVGDPMSSLYALCKEWLILDAFRNSKVDANVLLLKIMKEKHFSEQAYTKWNNKVAKSLNAAPYRDANHHYLLWKQTHLSVFKASYNHIENDSKEVLLNKAEEELDSFYALAKIQYCYERIAIAGVKNTENNKFSIPEIAHFSENQLAAKSPLVCFFANIIQAYLLNDNSFYETALEILSTFDHQISPTLLPFYYAGLSNYAIRKFNEEGGKQRFFDLQILALEKDWITGGGQITSTLFLNIVNTGCLLGEIDLVQQVIENYGSRIPKKYQTGSIIFAEARVLFAEKQFEQAAQKLNKAPYDFELAFARIHCMLVRCYYELRATDWNRAQTFCINFKRNSKRASGINEINKVRFSNFAELTLKLLRKKPNWEKLLVEVEGMEVLACKDWLLEKVREGMMRVEKGGKG